MKACMTRKCSPMAMCNDSSADSLADDRFIPMDWGEDFESDSLESAELLDIEAPSDEWLVLQKQWKVTRRKTLSFCLG